MPRAASHLVGREEELAATARLLDAREELPGVAVLTGDAGMGKTALWLAGIDAAAARGYRTLASRPSEAETRLSFAGLADLLGAVADDLLPDLPPAQERALEAALLLGDPAVEADERAVAAAFLGALRLLAGDGPVCVAVDDLQWLDGASLAALRFALARLDHEPAAVLLAVRGGVPGWLRRALPAGRLQTVAVKGLSVGATRELLRVRLGATFPRPTLMKLWEASGGNPFYALELADALQRRGGTLAPGEELPVPSDLDELLLERIDGLGPLALEVVRVVAALAGPTAEQVEAALGADADDGLAEAIAARILELDGADLRFTHPLLGSAVIARWTPARRRSLHARLAEVVPSREERARHLALATAGPDREAAAVLEEAARSAQARGAPGAAAELAEQALRLTAPADVEDRHRRLLLAARRQHAAGDGGRAAALLERAGAEAPPGVQRAAVLIQLAEVQTTLREAVALYRRALAEAEGEDALEATIHLCLAELMRFDAGAERGIEHAEHAVRAAARTGDLALRCRALGAHALMRFNAGRPLTRAELEDGLALERKLPEGPLDIGPATALSHQLVWSVELDPARILLGELLDASRTRGNTGGEAAALWYLSVLEWRAGTWDEADRLAAGALELKTQLGQVELPDAFPAAIAAAHRGRTDDAGATAREGVARAEADGVRTAQAAYGWVLGFIELSQGDPAAAVEHLRRAHELPGEFLYEPAMRNELGDLVEALIALGEHDEAAAVLETWHERAVALDRAWSLAILARGRGLLLAARGQLDDAFASFDHALAEHARTADPFQHARTLLALGRTQRRAKRRAAARATLEDALAAFERLGAPLWAEQTRAELARIGGRAPSRGELTEAERRIAGLVAEGRTNREVAGALFLTEHSVETALTRVYRKLGVRSRAELTRLLSTQS